MNLSERSMGEVEVIDCQPTQFAQPQTHLSGQSSHHVRPGRGQPFAMLGQLIAPGTKEGGQVLRRRWNPDLEVARVARSIALVDRRRDDSAGQLLDFTCIAQFQEAEEQVDHAGFPPAGRRRPPTLIPSQEAIRVAGFDLPDPHTSRGQELLNRVRLEANRAVSDAMGQTCQNVLRHQMFLIGRGFLRILHRAWGPQISHNTQQCDPSSSVQESRHIS